MEEGPLFHQHPYSNSTCPSPSSSWSVIYYPVLWGEVGEMWRQSRCRQYWWTQAEQQASPITFPVFVTDPACQKKLMLGDQEQLVRFSIRARRMGHITHAQRLLSRLRVRCGGRPPLSLWAGWVLDSILLCHLLLSVAIPFLSVSYFSSLKLFPSISRTWHCCRYYLSWINKKALRQHASLKENRFYLLEFHHLPHLSEYLCADGRNRWELGLDDKGGMWKTVLSWPDYFVFSDIISLWWGQIYFFIFWDRVSCSLQ